MSFTLSQWGLLLDGIGFLLVFAFGGFSIGAAEAITTSEPTKRLAYAARIAGMVFVLAGFALQFMGTQKPVELWP